MRRAELFVIALVAALSGAAHAEVLPVSGDAPGRSAVFDLPGAGGGGGEATAAPARSARLLGEGLTVATAGVVLPVAAYVGLTAGLQSFVGFFAGIATATLIGAIAGPIAVIVASQLLGLKGGAGRGVVGALAGLALGLLIGLPLATLPSALYLAGLVVLWALPSAGAMVGMEWGQAPAAPPTGLTVARF